MLLGVSIVLIGGAGVCLWWAYSRPLAQRKDFLELGGFALALIGVLIPVIGLLRSARRRADPRSVNTLADLLAQAVRAQWRTAATERALLTPAPIAVRWSLSTLPVAGSVAAAIGVPDEAPAFPPLPGQNRVTEERLREGGSRRELFDVYAGVASGRVVVVGAPGAGKSGAAVLLVLDALHHRDTVGDTERVRVPVPVLLTAHSWDPHTCSALDWLVTRLAADYPLFQHRGGYAEARALVRDEKVALILDGLDEMDEAARPAALQALSDAPFRVVVLSRSHEMIHATETTWLAGAVALHLREVTGSEAADYLQRANPGPTPSRWAQLLAELREHPGNVLPSTLTNPLALTLVRDTYRAGDDISPLLDTTRYRGREDMEQDLIARVLPAAYLARPGRPPPRYSLTQATQALGFIARHMNHDRTRDLLWSHIPRWAPTTPRLLASMLAGGVLGGLVAAPVCWLVSTLAYGPNAWLNFTLFGLGYGAGVGLLLGLANGRGGREPKRVKNWRAVSLRRVLTTGLAYGIVVGLAGSVVAIGLMGLITLRSPDLHKMRVFWLLFGLEFGLIFGLPFGLKRDLLFGLAGAESSPQRALKSWRQDLTFGLTFGLLVGFLAGLWNGSMTGLLLGLLIALMTWLMRRFAGRFAVGLALGLEEGERSPQGPLASWRDDRVFGLVVGLTFGLAVGMGWVLTLTLIPFATNSEALHAPMTASIGVIIGLVVGLVYGVTSSVTWPTTLAWLQLRRSRRVPAVGLMPFLDDARTRGVLRTVGAVYQFRHATLQDHLASQATSSPATSSEPGQPEPALFEVERRTT